MTRKTRPIVGLAAAALTALTALSASASDAMKIGSYPANPT